jgi:hypothetical protein
VVVSKELAPIDTIGVAAKLEERGVSVGVRSRFTTAVDRLLGCYVDLLRAHAEGLEDRIRSRNEIKLRAVPEEDREAVQIECRTLEQRAKETENVAAAGRVALEILTADQTSENQAGEAASDGSEIEPDWLNLYEKYAGAASSERMQILWGRVLAGEVRGPGAFSYATLRFIAELDRSLAEKTETAFRNVIGNVIIHPAEMKGEIFNLYNVLSQRGLLTGFEGFQNVTINISDGGVGFLVGNTHVARIFGEANTTINQSVLFLTEVGKEILPLLEAPDEPGLFKDWVKQLDKGGITKIELGLKIPDNRMRIVDVLFENGSSE